MTDQEKTGWDEWRMLLHEDIKNLRIDIAELQKSMLLVRENISALNVKAGIYGAVSGLVAAALTVFAKKWM